MCSASEAGLTRAEMRPSARRRMTTRRPSSARRQRRRAQGIGEQCRRVPRVILGAARHASAALARGPSGSERHLRWGVYLKLSAAGTNCTLIVGSSVVVEPVTLLTRAVTSPATRSSTSPAGHHTRCVPHLEFHPDAHQFGIERFDGNLDAGPDRCRPGDMACDDAVDRGMARQQEAQADQIVHEVERVAFRRAHPAEQPVDELLQPASSRPVEPGVLRQHRQVAQHGRSIELAEPFNPGEAHGRRHGGELRMETRGHLARLLELGRRGRR